jgi:hypothetical protein
VKVIFKGKIEKEIKERESKDRDGERVKMAMF